MYLSYRSTLYCWAKTSKSRKHSNANKKPGKELQKDVPGACFL
jgi:hypothetical protein